MKKQMKKHTLFIGISGKMGTGKSTVSKLIRKSLDKSVISSIASPLYKAQDLIYKEYGLTLEGEKDRDLLIALGLWGRNKSPDFWLEQFVKRAIEGRAEIVICDDIRFENEAKFFEENGVLIRLEGAQRGDNVDYSRADDKTETSLDNYKFKNVIINIDKSPEEICLDIACILMGKELVG